MILGFLAENNLGTSAIYRVRKAGKEAGERGMW